MGERGMHRRIAWVDYAKGIAIIGVFMMHSAYPVALTSVIASFDMMLFFFLSGFVFSIRKYPTFRLFLWHRIRTLVIPGLVLAAIGDCITIIVDVASGGSVGNILIHIAGYAINLRGRAGLGQIPWFLTCVFLMEIMAYVLIQLTKRSSHRLCDYAITAIVFFIVGYAYSVWIHIVLPWAGDVALALFAFYIVGMMLRQAGEPVQNVLMQPVMMLPMAIAFGVSVFYEDHIIGIAINPYLNVYGNVVCYAVASISGIYLVLAFCHLLESCHSIIASKVGNMLQYWGENTLVYYCVNAAIYTSFIPTVLGVLSLDVHSSDMRMQVACGTLAVLINLVICPLVAELINRYCPLLLGRPRKRMLTISGKENG